jgi:hypothetical protein
MAAPVSRVNGFRRSFASPESGFQVLGDFKKKRAA